MIRSIIKILKKVNNIREEFKHVLSIDIVEQSNVLTITFRFQWGTKVYEDVAEVVLEDNQEGIKAINEFLIELDNITKQAHKIK